MRNTDLKRIDKAKQYLTDAENTLIKIKWENRTSMEDYFLSHVGDRIADAKSFLDDIKHIQK